MALHSFFYDYWFLYTRVKGNLLSSFCGSTAMDGTDGCPLVPVAAAYGKGNSVYRR